jgi:uncharacterized protein YbcI
MGDDGRCPPVDEGMLDAVTEAMVAFHVRYHGRAPASARSRLLGDDLLACVFGDLYTDVEKTLIETRGPDLVHESRTVFAQAMQQRLGAEVSRITDRHVERVVTSHHVGPDLGVALFFLGPREPLE